MASYPAAKVLRLTVQTTVNGNRLSNVLHYGTTGSPAAGAPADFVTQFIADVLPTWLDAISVEASVESIVCGCVAPDTMRQESRYLNAQLGTINGEALPSNTGPIIQLRQTEISGRHNGRIMVVGVNEDSVLDSRLDAVYQAGAFTDLANKLDDQITAGGIAWDPVVLQRFDSGAPITPVAWKVTLARVTAALGTNRRRTTELRSFQ